MWNFNIVSAVLIWSLKRWNLPLKRKGFKWSPQLLPGTVSIGELHFEMLEKNYFFFLTIFLFFKFFFFVFRLCGMAKNVKVELIYRFARYLNFSKTLFFFPPYLNCYFPILWKYPFWVNFIFKNSRWDVIEFEIVFLTSLAIRDILCCTELA